MSRPTITGLIENIQNKKRMDILLKQNNPSESVLFMGDFFKEHDYLSFGSTQPKQCYSDVKSLLEEIPECKRHLFGTLHFFTRTRNIPMKPEESILHEARYPPEESPVYWGYHVTVIDITSRVYDLALQKEYFGISYPEYKEALFHRVNPYDQMKINVSLIPSDLFLTEDGVHLNQLIDYQIGSLQEATLKYFPVLLDAFNQKSQINK